MASPRQWLCRILHMVDGGIQLKHEEGQVLKGLYSIQRGKNCYGNKKLIQNFVRESGTFSFMFDKEHLGPS